MNALDSGDSVQGMAEAVNESEQNSAGSAPAPVHAAVEEEDLIPVVGSFSILLGQSADCSIRLNMSR